ncbi:MAG: hypothetical protein ACYS0I_04195 [Planctomycetota bacterium]|jgi:hypothetical protein
MKTLKLSILLAIAILLTAASAQSKEEPKEISNTRTASCLLKVTADPAILPLSFDALQYLMHSSGVSGKAAHKVLDLSPDIGPELFYIDHLPSSPASTPPLPQETKGKVEPAVALPPPAAEQSLLVLLQVELHEDYKPAAEEFMNALIDNLTGAIRTPFYDYRGELTRQLAIAQKEAEEAEGNLVKLQRELREISGSRDLSRQTIINDIRQLRKQLEGAEMELGSHQATVKAISEQIAKTENKAKEQLEKDPVTKELVALLKSQQQHLENTQKLAPFAELATAEEKLARARIELAQRREQITKNAGGELLGQLNNRLAELSIQRTQTLANYENLRHKIDRAEQLLKRADTFELESLKAELAKQNFREATLLNNRMKRRISLLQPPTVSVFGAN